MDGATLERSTEISLSKQIYSCANPKDIPLFSRKDLPKEVWSKIRTLQELDTRKNWRILLFYALWAAAGWVYLLHAGLLLSLACVVVMGLCVNALPILMHDACHVLLSKNIRINRWLGFLCGLPGLVAGSAYRSIHTLHHADTRTADDPDDLERNSSRFLPLVLVYYIVLFFGVYLYIFTVAATGYKKANSAVRRDIIVEYALMTGIFTAAFLLFPAAAVLGLWVYPLLFAAQLANVRGIAEHGLTTGGNPFTNTRTVVSNRFVSFFMCNLNYHLEHHLFPGIPYYNLPELHALLTDVYAAAGSSVYTGYGAFLKDFFRTTFSGVAPGLRMIPKHIREDICG